MEPKNRKGGLYTILVSNVGTTDFLTTEDWVIDGISNERQVEVVSWYSLHRVPLFLGAEKIPAMIYDGNCESRRSRCVVEADGGEQYTFLLG